VAYCSYGASTFQCNIGSRLSLHVRLEFSLGVGTAGIQIRLALYTTIPGGQQIRYLDIPYRALVAMAFENNSFLANLHEKWYNSASVELLGLGSGSGGRNKRMKTSSNHRCSNASAVASAADSITPTTTDATPSSSSSFGSNLCTPIKSDFEFFEANGPGAHLHLNKERVCSVFHN
jgi:hypothetical protein